ncbi:MAG: InlB B-repeat-containing protein [Treponema sp.]|nr:InlB B-repeat-containing protein [Treponema sp.]
MLKKNLWIVALIAALAMIFAGCGGGGSTVVDDRPWADEDLVITDADDIGALLVPRHLFNDNVYTDPDGVVSSNKNVARFNFPTDNDIDNIGFRVDFPSDGEFNPIEYRYNSMTIEFEVTEITTLDDGEYAKLGFKEAAFPEIKVDMTPYAMFEVWFGTPTAVSAVGNKKSIVIPLADPNKAPFNAVWFTHNKYASTEGEWNGKKGSDGPIDYKVAITKIVFGAAEIIVPEYTITFDTNGGIPATIDSVSVKEGYPIGDQMPANPTHETKGFIGWFIGDTDVEYANSAITEALALKAKYADYDSQATVGDGAAAVLTHYLPKFVASTVPQHGTFAGTIADNGSAMYTGGAIAYNFPTEADEYDVVELYINVAGDNRDAITKQATSSTDVVRYPTGNQYPTLAVGTSQLVFVKAEAGTGIALQTNNATPAATFTLLKAVYKKGTYFEVTFDGGTNTSMTPIDSQTIIKDRKVTLPPVPVWDDTHDFVGWFIDSVDGTAFTGAEAITADIDLVAKWVEVTERKVSFDLNGATSPASIADVTVAVSGTLDSDYPSAPTKTGYTFDGWWDADNMIEYKADTVIKKDVTLKARWVLTPTSTSDIEVPLTGLTVREDLSEGGASAHTGFWIDLSTALSGITITDFDRFSVVLQRYDSQGNKVGNGWDIRLAFSTTTITDFGPKDLNADSATDKAEIQYVWWNVNANSSQAGTNTAFTEETSAGGTAKGTALTTVPTAVGLIRNGGGYSDLALVSLTLHRVAP